MPNKIRRNSVVEMLSKVPVNRGSLLKSLDSLLKTIESSETAVMIPTLLRDKCNFDAWELMFVAKILKASILGHTDLVEFYMNHMRTLIHQQQKQADEISASQSPSTPTRAPLTSPMSSPNLSRSPSEPGNGNNNGSPAAAPTAHSPPFSPSNSVCSGKTTSSSSNGTSQTKSQTSGSVWVSASSCLASSLSSSSTLNSEANDATSSGFGSNSVTTCESVSSTLSKPVLSVQEQQVMQELQSQLNGLNGQNDTNLLAAGKAANGCSSNQNGTTNQQRQAQPPSLLQLTTTNNHINSIAQVSLSNTAIDAILAQQSASNSVTTFNLGTPLSNSSTPTAVDGALSISTGLTVNANGGAAPTSELRTSRSAGCLFRANSCASSPRTPHTPHSIGQQLSISGQPVQTTLPSDDPSAPVKLLLQIEQLKASILSVTDQLESVVELYKKSIESIST